MQYLKEIPQLYKFVKYFCWLCYLKKKTLNTRSKGKYPVHGPACAEV